MACWEQRPDTGMLDLEAWVRGDGAVRHKLQFLLHIQVEVVEAAKWAAPELSGVPAHLAVMRALGCESLYCRVKNPICPTFSTAVGRKARFFAKSSKGKLFSSGWLVTMFSKQGWKKLVTLDQQLTLVCGHICVLSAKDGRESTAVLPWSSVFRKLSLRLSLSFTPPPNICSSQYYGGEE